MGCTHCGQAHPPGARFCNGCGAPLAGPCPACGHANPPGSRFCSGCGRRLAPAEAAEDRPARFVSPEAYTPSHLAEKILTARSALTGERKQVTVLFADIKGSLELLAERDPEDARALLDGVLERMMEAVHRYEGTVNQVMGDGIMALFGAPVAHEDHAVRACYAALRMLEAVGRRGEAPRRAQGVPVQIRVGLNSGEVVVGAIGSDLRMEYTAVGQTTHLAARMEQLARPGSALLAEATFRLAAPFIQVRPLGALPVKGLGEPVEAFELVGALPARTPFQALAARGLTRFVGRRDELEALHQALGRADGGRGQVVAIAGEPGVGKSRLVWEFAEACRRRGVRVLTTSAVSYGKATPYLPVRDLLRSSCQVEEADDARTIREKVTGSLLALDEALRPLLPALLGLFELAAEDPGWTALDGAERRRRTVEPVRRVLTRESQHRPLVVAFEDLHWIDPASQAVLDGLVEALPASRLLLLVTYRPEYRHGWAGRAAYRQLRLDPLGGDGAGALLDALLGDDPALARLKPLLLGRTGGNPFFLEESVRTLAQTRVLAGERGAYRLARALPTLRVPDTVQALLAARIDRLPHEGKHLLQGAAAIGEDVPLALLQAIADLPEDALRRGLERLQAAELLYETALFPEIEYAFGHALTHEVAYASLLHEQRRALHARIVEAIEALYPDRLAEQAHRLAHHAFRGEVWGKALRYLTRAGREAMPAESDAPGLLSEGPESPGALWWTGQYERALAAGRRDLAVAADFGNVALSVVSSYRLGQIHHALGQYPSAVESLRRNATVLEGDLAREKFGLRGLASALSLAWLAWCLADRGEFPEALVSAHAALALADAADDLASRALAAFALGHLHLARDDGERAIPALEQGLAVCRLEDLPLTFPLVAAALGLAYARGGRPGDGVALLEEALARAEATRLRAHQSLRLGLLAEAEALAGRPERARAAARRALALAREHGERPHQAAALRVLGDLATAGDPESAEASYRGALDLAEALGLRPLEAHCRLALGRLLRAGARPAEARVQLDAAARAFRGLEMPGWAERAEAELAVAG